MTRAADPAAPARRRGRLRVAAVVGLAVAVLAGWLGIGAWTAHHVAVSWTASCDGQPRAEGTAQAPVTSKPGWRCDVLVRIENASFRSVHVSGLEGPFMGSGGGAEVRGLSTDGAELATGGPHDIDGRWQVDVTVPAHSSRVVLIAIGWRQGGCNSAGLLTIDTWPTAVIQAWGRTLRIRPHQDLGLRTLDDPHDAVACPDAEVRAYGGAPAHHS
jgi:hypothetical protein